MKNVGYTLFLTILVSSVFSFAATDSKKETAAEISRNIEIIYKKVFAGRNLVASDFSEKSYEPWLYVLATLGEWINQLLLVERSLGSRISASNKEAILNSMEQIKHLSKKLIATIGSLHELIERNKQFTPPLQVFKSAQGDIKELNNAYEFTLTLKKSLTPGLLDVRDTIDMKTILRKIFSLLSVAIKKISDDVIEFDNKVKK